MYHQLQDMVTTGEMQQVFPHFLLDEDTGPVSAASVGCRGVEGHPDHLIGEAPRIQGRDHHCRHALSRATAQLGNSEKLGASNLGNNDREMCFCPHVFCQCPHVFGGQVHHELAIPVNH